MRVGLDIDNVIASFDKAILEEYYIFDKKKRNKGIINKNSTSVARGMFDWNEKEVEEFFTNNMERIAKTLEVRYDAKYYMDKMIEDGHELYLISHRVYPDYNNPFETTKKWLEDNNINYTKLILSKTINKSPECKDNKVDIMFDDALRNCQKLLEENINCYMMKTKYNQAETHEIPYVLNWEDLYEKVCDEANKKSITN